MTDAVHPERFDQCLGAGDRGPPADWTESILVTAILDMPAPA